MWPGVDSADLPEMFQEELRRAFLEIPFHNGSRQIPCDIGRAREEVIIAMSVGVNFDEGAVLRAEPFMWLHASIGKNRLA